MKTYVFRWLAERMARRCPHAVTVLYRSRWVGEKRALTLSAEGAEDRPVPISEQERDRLLRRSMEPMSILPGLAQIADRLNLRFIRGGGSDGRSAR